MNLLTRSQGKKLIELAKKSINSRLDNTDLKIDESVKREFSSKRGVFVTLTLNSELRGCIGYAEGIFPIFEGIVKAASSAALADPRFSPLSKKEFENIKIEVSVLTEPKLINVKDSSEYLNKIKIGEDGLIIEGVMGKGLLLPQVAPEWKWSVLEFLENTCQKAGLDKDAWKDISNKIYKFQAQIFSES